MNRRGASLLAALAALAACTSPPALSPSEARARLLARLPAGWTLVQDRQGEFPFEQHPGRTRPRGEALVLIGPTPVRVSGYHCGGAYCEDQPAQEALELWVMPAGYADDMMTSLMALRTPERMYRDAGVQVFALPSRWLEGRPYDADVTEASREASTLGPSHGGDPPLSWSSWRGDIVAALRPPRRGA